MPAKKRTTEKEIIKLLELENRIIITKDKDFLDSRLLYNQLLKLVLKPLEISKIRRFLL
jgi:predicted nuclease of predicted toxin-antitoxin system